MIPGRDFHDELFTDPRRPARGIVLAAAFEFAVIAAFALVALAVIGWLR